ncbi:hypothetical protein CPB83DRAFT_846937 [Crepidotus variabilis]|uniref:Uncharacterized protein n=1 Tax=Crepidotus variabilis TaxID=179855 RepID=A0A9P6JSZ9_9AGAR|nr:hypothetical protein CPB83DRAFT_846937 [Crepidotus variabilis]
MTNLIRASMGLIFYSDHLANSGGPSNGFGSVFTERDGLENMDGRKGASIIYSCLFTLLVCMTFCVRPNIPSPSTSRARFASIKLYMMAWMILTPHTMLYWAALQWFQARSIGKKYASRGWTTAHGHFVVMGGFLACKEGVPYQVLSPRNFQELVDQNRITFPTVTNVNLNRQTQTHPLLSGACVLQTLWFVTQVISCAANGLETTPLEIATLILVVMNGVLLIAFWSKPLDVVRPIRIDLIDSNSDLNSPNATPNRTYRDDFFRENALTKRVRDLVEREALHILPQHIPIARRITVKVISILSAPIFKVARDLVALYFRPFAKDIVPGALSVPTFYASLDADTTITVYIPYVFGTIFGGSHLWAYFHAFSPDHDDLAWRISIVALAGVCGASLVVLVLCHFTQFCDDYFETSLTTFLAEGSGVLFGITMLFVVPTSILARMVMLIEVFIKLKEFHPVARQSLSWTNYIPHFT